MNAKQKSLFAASCAIDPETYSGETANATIRGFIEAIVSLKSTSPLEDHYKVEPFDTSIDTTKATSIYNMHTYWSKKPHDAIRTYIRHFTDPGDLVLDPFCGSGGTALASLIETRAAIAIDRSPAATFITKHYCTPVDRDDVKEEFRRLTAAVSEELDWLYVTRCHSCGGKATTAHTVYSQTFKCTRCVEIIKYSDCISIKGQTKAGKPKKIYACPNCYRRGITEEISSRDEKLGSVPVMFSIVCQSGCKRKKSERRHNDEDEKKREYFEKFDLAKIAEIENSKIPYWIPKGYDMTSFARYKRDALFYYGIKEVTDLFTRRNLWALALLKAHLPRDSVLNFCYSSIILNSSRLYRHRSGGGGGPKGTDFMIPQIGREMPVWPQFTDKVRALLKNPPSHGGKIRISTQSACDLSQIPSNTIDYIFTDPPYGGTIQYGELSSVWEAWQGFSWTWHADEITINASRGKSEGDWALQMASAMAECFRVLRPGRWLSLCYHDTSEGTWALVQDIMAEVGFLVDRSDTALFIDTGQKSYNQLTADKVNKRDLVINFRKPKPGEATQAVAISGTENPQTFKEKVHAIIRAYLELNPGATKDKIYDEVVSNMVRSGLMEAHNFEQYLKEIADEVAEPRKMNLFEDEPPNLFGDHIVSRWYLKEAELEVADAAESAKEESAAMKLRAYIKQAVQEDPSLDGIHYSDLFEQYIYTTRDKPRRVLADWLLDYFYKTDTGTFRLPINDEEERLKSEGRAKGTNRRIKRFISLITQGVVIRDSDRPGNSTLAEWILNCKRSGLYGEGKLLYEKGGLDLDDLPEEVMVNVEEDYQVCVRMLRRDAK